MKTVRLLACLVVLALGAAGWSEVGLICRLAPGADPVRVAERYTIILRDRTDPAPFSLFGVDEARKEAVRAAMAGDPEVVWTEDDGRLAMPEHDGAGKGSTIGVVGDRGTLLGMNGQFLAQIGWSRMHAESRFGRRVRLAVLDTGLSPRQPELWGSVVAQINVIEQGSPAWDIPTGTDSNGNGLPDEGTGHGTMVAGLVRQVAPHVDLVIARVADSDGLSSAWRLTKGMAFAVVEGVKVLNVSLGSTLQIPAMTNVLDWVEENAAICVAAAGNNGVRGVNFPSRISKTICVTGVDGSDVKAPFANWESAVDSCAPATGLRSYWWDGTLGVWSGTSFATPLASGVLADCLRRRGSISLAVVRETFEASGDDVDDRNPLYRGQIGTRLNHARLEAILPGLLRGGRIGPVPR